MIISHLAQNSSPKQPETINTKPLNPKLHSFSGLRANSTCFGLFGGILHSAARRRYERLDRNEALHPGKSTNQ